MLALLLALSTLFAQGGPVLTNQSGTITGVLRSAAGEPAAGVRVSALTRPEAINDLAAAVAFAGLGETDSTGRYRLENIPPGRYYIVAGRVDAPTYYPGTLQAGEGTVVAVTPGLTVSAIDFVLNAGSVGRANLGASSFTPGPSWVIPIQTRVENGGKIPWFAAGLFPVVRIAGMEVPLSGPSFTLSMPAYQGPAPSIPDYRVTIENLPETYALTSLTSGSTDLQANPLKLPGSQGTIVTPPIVATLALRAARQPGGIRVSGWIGGNPQRSIYISGNPGAIFSDGTFEFVGVPAGRHNIVTVDSSGVGRILGAALVAGERDLPNVELEEISIAPADYDQPTPPQPAGTRLPASRSATVSIRGRVVDADTHEPFNAGKIVLNGSYSIAFPLKEDGRFEVPKLLPGKYVVEGIVYGIGIVKREVIVDEADAVVELTVRSDP